MSDLMTEVAEKYPECEKLRAIQPKSQIVGEFLDDCGFTLCEWNDTACEWQPIRLTMEQLLARAYDIDLDKVEEERRRIIAEIREGGEHGS